MIFLNERCEAAVRELKALRQTNVEMVSNFRIRSKQANDFDIGGGGFQELAPDRLWGGAETYYHLQTGIKPGFDGGNFYFSFDIDKAAYCARNVQALVFVDGSPAAGLDINHTECLVTQNAVKGKTYKIDIIVYSGAEAELFKIGARTFHLDEIINKLFYDIKIPYDVARELSPSNDDYLIILEGLNPALDLLDTRKPYSQAFYESVDSALKYLETEFYEKICKETRVIEAAIGHTHIDVAWLWPLHVTKDKAVRSFATVLHLMERYPEYIFMSSQPQLYMYLKELCPPLYEKIKERAAEGRWETEGGMWLEADCNLTGGESLVRQVIHGKKFFREEFGYDSRILWLPDVFGYSAALPQILKKSGIDYFMTTKINWNDTNKLPCDTFNWQGIDGSEVFSHFITTSKYMPIKNDKSFYTTYNGDTDANSVLGCWQRYQHKELNGTILNCYGYGDGGGGPTAEMLENMRRYKGIPGSPAVKPMKALDFFNEIHGKLAGNKRLKKWVGELYFEYHRGTLTTMARNKKYNRKTEFKNLGTEWLYSLCGIYRLAPYPAQELDRVWKITLLNQFHDILPGSSIKEVYEDSEKQYKEINAELDNLNGTALNLIARNVTGAGNRVTVFNQLSFERDDFVVIDNQNGNGVKVLDGGCELPAQSTYDGKLVFYAQNIPASGYKTYSLEKSAGSGQNVHHAVISDGGAGCLTVKTDLLEVKVSADGTLSSVYDTGYGREILKGAGNVLRAYEDKPILWDAWELRNYYKEKSYPVETVASPEIVENGPVRTVLKVKRRYQDSDILQYIVINNFNKRIDFLTEIDWKENNTLLKTEFPADINAAQAVYDIQFGNFARSTHENTSWDEAQFEVCGHKWADVSEGGYGAALLNDCKYGYDIRDSVLRLSLLRAPSEPNPEADREKHSFVYSLLPHNGNYIAGGVVKEGYKLNCPLTAVAAGSKGGSLPENFALFNINTDNIIAETFKKAENNEAYIMRMYECHNTKTNASVKFNFPVKRVFETDLLENDIAELKATDGKVDFTIKPFEIKTFKIII